MPNVSTNTANVSVPAALDYAAQSAIRPLIEAFTAGQTDAVETLSRALSGAPCFGCDGGAVTYRTVAALSSYLQSGAARPDSQRYILTLSGVSAYGSDAPTSARVAVCLECFADVASTSARMPAPVDCAAACGASVRTSPHRSTLPYSVARFDRFTASDVYGSSFRTVGVHYGETALYVDAASAEYVGSEPYCSACAAARAVCDGCGSVALRSECASGSDCDGCRDAGHYGARSVFCVDCAPSDLADAHSGHAGRRAFVARRDIGSALDVAHRPGRVIRSTRLIGCEVECQSDTVPALGRAFALESNAAPLWAGIGTDGSIETDCVGYEVRGLPLGGATLETFVTVTRAALDVAGLSGNLSTGVHAHVDMRDAAVSEVYAFAAVLSAAQPILFGATDAERWAHSGEYGAQYAPPVSASDALSFVASATRSGRYASSHVGNVNGDRYSAVNLEAYSEWQTVEVRAFGTDVLHSADFPHVLAFVAALADVTLTSASVRADLLDAVTASGGRFGSAECAALLDVLAAQGLLSGESVRALGRVARYGVSTLTEADSVTECSGSDYCGRCGEYVRTVEADCGCCSACEDCGHTI